MIYKIQINIDLFIITIFVVNKTIFYYQYPNWTLFLIEK